MKRIKICLISLTVSPDSQDGAAKVIRALFEYLKKRGHHVKLVTGKWNTELKEPNIIQFKLIKKRFLWAPHFILQVIKFLLTHKFDIIHGNGPKGTLPIILSYQKRFISTIHDLGPFEANFSKIPLEKLLIRFVALKAKYITTVSNFIRKEFKYFIPKIKTNKIFNLYNGIEDKFKPYPDKAQRLKEKLNINGPVLLYIGRITSYKGIEDMITAYKKAKNEIPHLNLVIGGNPDFSMQKKYFEWKAKYKEIYFLGFVPEDEIPYYYSMGDIFITYSYASEGFGLTPIEAIACGTPVICSSISVYKEILQDNAIFVPPKNPSLLANEIINLIKDDEKRSTMIKKAQHFIKRYTWDSVGKKLEEVYEKLLNH